MIETNCCDTCAFYCAEKPESKICKRYKPFAGIRIGKTCSNVTEENPVDQFVCSACGLILEGYHRREIDHDDGYEIYYEFVPRFCPNCGSKVVDEA